MTDPADTADGAQNLASVSNAAVPLEHPGVQGQIRIDELNDRLTVFNLKATVSTPADIGLYDNPADDANLVFCLPVAGSLAISLPTAGTSLLAAGQPFWAMPDENRATLSVRPGPLKLVGLGITARMLEEHAETLGRLHPLLQQALSHHPSPFVLAARRNPQLARVAAELVHAPFQGSLRALYQEAKALELIALSLAALGTEPERSVVRLRELDRLHEARERLLADLAAPPTLTDLCLAVGLNRNKLLRGFREHFGATPFELLRQARLDHARTLLEEGVLSIAEIAFACGYEHPASFTHAFIERFGMPPSRWPRG